MQMTNTITPVFQYLFDKTILQFDSVHVYELSRDYFSVKVHVIAALRHLKQSRADVQFKKGG